MRRASRVAALAATILASIVAPAAAHHILGIPHYAYDEEYPQVPVLTYRVHAGSYELKLTGYPGKPEPGDYCTVHVYIQHLETGEPFDGTVSLSVMKDRMIGEDPVVYGPVEAVLEEAVYKFFPKFEDESNYTVRIAYEAENAPWIIDLPMVVGEPGSPWTVLGAAGGGLVVFLVVIRAIRIKMRRRMSGRTAA